MPERRRQVAAGVAGRRPRPLRPDAGRRPRDDGAPLRLLFAGTVGLAQGLDVLVDASQLAGPEVVQTQIAGDGADAERIAGVIRDQA